MVAKGAKMTHSFLRLLCFFAAILVPIEFRRI